MTSTPDYPIIVEIVCPDEKSAESIAEALVTAKLVACANILPAVSSIYRWKGKVERATEAIVLAKTMQSCFEKGKAMVLSLHSYENPCIVSWKIDEVHQDYLDWIGASIQ